MFDSFRFVLVQTSHPGNIGGAARALKNMGFAKLYLVNPNKFPDEQASARAAGADDVLDNVIVVDTLEQAIADCGLVIGASARTRTLPWPLMTPRECAEKAVAEAGQHQIAIVFGAEQSGLSNEQLQQCHIHVHIPTNPDYRSLNLAAAVQVLSYELKIALDADKKQHDYQNIKYPNADALNHFYERFEQTLLDIEFFDKRKSKSLMSRVRRLFNRARLEEEELNILQGILTAINKKI